MLYFLSQESGYTTLILAIFLYKKPELRIRIHFIGIRIRVQHLRMNTNPDPDPIRIQGFNDQKLKKITAENCFVFLSKTAILNLPIPMPP